MKKLILILILIIVPFSIYAQELGIDYPFNKFNGLNQKQLEDRLAWNSAGKISSYVLIGGGVAGLTVGTYYCIEYGYLAAVGILSGATESPLGAFITYLMAAGSISGFGLAVLGYGAIKFSLDSIKELNFNRHLIEIELKQFHPTSYKDSRGIGIGISIALN